MIRLAWDTSSVSAEIAIEFPDGKTIESRFDGQASVSERLLESIDGCLRTNGLDQSKIDEWIVGVGPGSFTGLRIGVTTARALSYALKKPVYGISSLSAACYSASQNFISRGLSQDQHLAWIRNAFGGEIYVCEGTLREHLLGTGQIVCISPSEWAKSKKSHAPFHIAGEGKDVLKTQLLNEDHIKWEDAPARFTHGLLALSRLPNQRLNQGDWAKVYPQYLRGSSAEEKLKTSTPSGAFKP